MSVTSTLASDKPDYDAIKARQQATWASGDYAVIGTTLQIVGERLCEAVDLCAGSAFSTLPPATAMPLWLPHAVSPRSPPPTTSAICFIAPMSALGPSGCPSRFDRPTLRPC